MRGTSTRAPPKPFSYMDSVLVEEFGQSGKELFKSIEDEPIGAASLAQVLLYPKSNAQILLYPESKTASRLFS